MHIKKQRLLTPGPTPLYPKALHAMMAADLHHRTQDFRDLYTRVLADLKEVLGTSHDVLVLVASGTGAMDASLRAYRRPSAAARLSCLRHPDADPRRSPVPLCGSVISARPRRTAVAAPVAGRGFQSRPRVLARSTASRRLPAPSLRYIDRRCALTVFTET